MAGKDEAKDKKLQRVIIDRIDQAVKHPNDILENAIDEGLEQYGRSKTSLFVSAIAAGLILSFSAILVAIVTEYGLTLDSPFIRKALVALVYPFGFILCILGGAQLFTEQTATAVYPLLDGKAKVMALFRLLVVVCLGNFVGTLISAAIMSAASDVIKAKVGIMHVHDHLLSIAPGDNFVSAILAGWLMAQGGWMILSTHNALAQIAFIYIVTAIIGICGFSHSIAGSAELFLGSFESGNWQVVPIATFLGVAVVGNLIGGMILVAMLNYGHIRQTQN